MAYRATIYVNSKPELNWLFEECIIHNSYIFGCQSRIWGVCTGVKCCLVQKEVRLFQVICLTNILLFTRKIKLKLLSCSVPDAGSMKHRNRLWGTLGHLTMRHSGIVSHCAPRFSSKRRGSYKMFYLYHK